MSKYWIKGYDDKPIALTCYLPEEGTVVMEFDNLLEALKNYTWLSGPYGDWKSPLMVDDKVLLYNSWDNKRGDYTPFRCHISRDLPLDLKKEVIALIRDHKVGFR